MNTKYECLTYLKNEAAELNKSFQKNEQITEELFNIFIGFIDEDYEYITDNKTYRLFLKTIKEIVIKAFENNASKSFMRVFFKKLNNKAVINYLSDIAPKQTANFKNSLARLVSEFVYWQESDHKKELKLNYLISIIDSWM